MNPNTLQILVRMVRGRGWRLIQFERFVNFHAILHNAWMETPSRAEANNYLSDSFKKTSCKAYLCAFQLSCHECWWNPLFVPYCVWNIHLNQILLFAFFLLPDSDYISLAQWPCAHEMLKLLYFWCMLPLVLSVCSLGFLLFNSKCFNCSQINQPCSISCCRPKPLLKLAFAPFCALCLTFIIYKCMQNYFCCCIALV